MSALSDDLRLPKEHGTAGETHEVLDLGGPLARITRTTYVGSRWTRLIVMAPPDHTYKAPVQSLEIVLSEKDLAMFVERLAWPK